MTELPQHVKPWVETRYDAIEDASQDALGKHGNLPLVKYRLRAWKLLMCKYGVFFSRDSDAFMILPKIG